ncbi:MAG TPA: N-acetylmuramoyl-L-alanine amidase-like domain-containing protein [Longimicrobiales bacterium]|nr:N-acetylmuramoyl-L-alanine amidase-like domain-containing protein [Longimicrobiales bacterium]
MRRSGLIVGLLALGAIAVAVWLLVDRGAGEPAGPEVVVGPGGEALAEPPGSPDEDVHREIFRERMEWARGEGLDTLPIGTALARLGETFVGTTYTPGTLDPEGAERLVVNLAELDCVTFLENMLAMVRVLRAGQTDSFEAFKRQLERIRYRGGEMDGYVSRLHYFSEWIGDNEEKGIVTNVTRELGGVRDPEPIHFMTSNRDAYWQLEDAEVVTAIEAIEERLSSVDRWVIPQARIADVASGIQDGDIIAATSALPGLDVAHTGMALWKDGRLHLLHAPLVGKSVEISEVPLARRIQGIEAQDGIMVARPR